MTQHLAAYSSSADDKYDEAVKRLSILIALADRRGKLTTHFERVGRLLASLPWATTESKLAQFRLRTAQHYHRFSETGAARHELNKLMRHLIKARNGEEEPWRSNQLI